MALRSALNAEMKRLKSDAKALEKKRAKLTANIDEQIAANVKKQQMLQEFMEATFGRKQKSKAADESTASGVRRTRKNRRGLKEKILETIRAHPTGVKRAGIISDLRMKADKAGHQYVSNMLSALMKEEMIRSEGRVYFPVTPATASDTNMPSASEGESSAASWTREDTSDSSIQGSGSNSNF